MEFYLQKGKITSHEDFNPREEWLMYPSHWTVKMWFAHGEIPFFSKFIDLINRYFEEHDREYRISEITKSEMLRMILRLINKNKAYMGGWVNLTVFEGFLDWKYIVRIEKYHERMIPFYENGILARISEEKIRVGRKPETSLIKSEAIITWEMLKLAGSRYGDSIFCNDAGAIVATTGGNLFTIENETVYTPSLNSGCNNDNFRQLVIRACEILKLKVVERDDIEPGTLSKMDEVFTVSEKTGFKWILGVGIKRFVKRKSESIREVTDQLLWISRRRGTDG